VIRALGTVAKHHGKEFIVGPIWAAVGPL